MATDNLTTDRPASSTEWADAFHNYQREVEAYANVAAEYEAACAEYDGPRTAPEAMERYDAAEKRHDAAADVLHRAREKVFATPAPDGDAMLAKLDILTAYLAECDDEDLPRVRAIQDDARRLFGRA